MRLRFSATSLLAAALAAAAFSHAAAATVSSVTVKATDGLGGDFSDVLSRCLVKKGAEYDPGAVQRDVRAIADTHRFESVSAENIDTEDGIEIVYVVKRKYLFKGPPSVKGNSYFSESRIARISKLVDGASVGESDLAAAAGLVRREYNRKFFPNAKVEARAVPVEGAPGAATVEIIVDEGERIKLNEYIFTGNYNVAADELRETFGQYPWYNPLGWFTDSPSADDELEAAAASVAASYRKKGYLDVVVPKPSRSPAEDGRTDIAFSVTEGPRYRVGSVSFSGVTNLSERVASKNGATGKTVEDLLRAAVEQALEDSWTPEEAELRPAGEDSLRKAAEAVEMYYGSRGIMDTRVQVKQIARERVKEPDGSDAGWTILDLEFAVEPGRPGYVRDIVVRGNDITKDKVIRREIRLSPNDPYNGRDAERAKKRLENLGYFSRVQMRLEKPADFDPEKESLQPYIVRDLVYEVAEQSTGNFGIGVGASSVDSVFGYVEISESNFDLFNPWRFNGGGQKARLNISAGPRIQTYEASITEPWFLDRQLELSVEGYRRLRWYDQYDVARSGFSASISYPVKFWPTWRTFGRIGFRYTLDFVQMSDVDDGLWGYSKGFTADDGDPVASRLYKREEERFDDAVESIFRVFWADNTLDHPYFPHSGYSALVFGDLSLGDNEYWRVGGTFRQYFTVSRRWNHVFSWRVHAETIDDISDDLPIYDRLFLGGPRTIRGVDYREIAPKVYRKGEHSPWGGKSSFNISAEYTVPLVQYVRVAGFTDLGAVGKDSFDPEFSDLCWSVGLGIRLDIPRFPVRLDFAVPVSKPDDVDKEVFSFSVGYDF